MKVLKINVSREKNVTQHNSVTCLQAINIAFYEGMDKRVTGTFIYFKLPQVTDVLLKIYGNLQCHQLQLFICSLCCSLVQEQFGSKSCFKLTMVGKPRLEVIHAHKHVFDKSFWRISIKNKMKTVLSRPLWVWDSK